MTPNAHQELDCISSLPGGKLSTADAATEIIILEPGLVLLRNFVSDEECQRLADTALLMGEEGEAGFYTFLDGTKVLNTGDNGRGRIYDAATRFGTNVTDLCPQAVEMARAVDPALPEMTCTHVLLNLYTNSDGLVWHRDIYENDGTSDHPVVNLCVGASCRFGFKHRDEDPDQEVILRSGDCLLFGGRCRLLKHAVLDVMLDDCPEWMKDSPFRLSFTFRDSPEVLGREEEFKYFKVKEHLVGQDDFQVNIDSDTTDNFKEKKLHLWDTCSSYAMTLRCQLTTMCPEV
jgi:alkylated DNA repair dioxygenase AlkB